jgi:hypothetical protein
MLNILMKARRALPYFLDLGTGHWKSMYITYEYPHVQRLWMPYEDKYRVYLHIIESIPLHKRAAGEKPFFHLHPWPSAVMLLKGAYRMGVRSQWAPKDQLKWMILSEGSSYEMTHPDDMHLVDPLDYDVMSLMVTEKPYNPPPKILPTPPQPELPAVRAEMLLSGFKSLLQLNHSIGIYPEMPE